MAAPEAGTSGNVLFILTSHNKLGDTGKATGWYLPEVAHAYRVLKGHGFAVTFATPLGGEAPMDPGSFDNFKDECDDFLQDKAAKEALNNTKRLEDVNPDDYKVSPKDTSKAGKNPARNTDTVGQLGIGAGCVLPWWPWTHVGPCQ
eukprot:gb/GECG01008176.1/.p1 GENE.gb/GECG01008176.1/~~gb/GECG01008176.1/.p1  ORF type:complete len:146 (+),score=18.59 gb/GECG01008176.1/:1-438(+)